MKNIIVLIYALGITLCCGVRKNLNHKKTPNYFVYEITDLWDKTEQEQELRTVDSTLLSGNPNMNLDSTKQALSKRDIMEGPEHKYLIVDKDWTCAHAKAKNKISRNYVCRNAKNDSLKVFSRYDPEELLGKWENELKNDQYIISEYDSERKNILGFRCKKVVLIEQFISSEIEDEGEKYIYELWVAEEININAQALLSIYTDKVKNLPLEVKMYESKTPESYTSYKLIETKKYKP